MKTDTYHVGIENSTASLEEKQTTEQEPCQHKVQKNTSEYGKQAPALLAQHTWSI